MKTIKERMKDPVEFAGIFQGVHREIEKDPIKNFIEAKWLINLDPTFAQRVILKTIFAQKLDGNELRDVAQEDVNEEGRFSLGSIQMTEVGLYKYLTGKDYIKDTQKINKVNLICGRRAGKTLIISSLAIWVALSRNWKPLLKKTSKATVIVMAQDNGFAQEILELLRDLITDSPILRHLLDTKGKQTADTVNLKVPFILKDGSIEYSRVQIKVTTASKKASRGKATCALICDEICWWNLDPNLKETDVKIMNAALPSTDQFGEHAYVFKLSSPALKQGVMYNEFKAFQEGTLPKSYVVFKGASWVINNLTSEETFRERLETPDTDFEAEYRANFVDSVTGFINPELVDGAINRGIMIVPPYHDKDHKYRAAIDAAFKGDRFTFTVVSVDADGNLTQHLAKGWQGTKYGPVSPTKVAKWIAEACKEYDIDTIAADQFAFQPLKEIFDHEQLTLEEFTFTALWKKKIYFNLKQQIHNQKLSMLDHERQITEIKQLVVTQRPTGAISIGHPSGGSDDYADSLAVATFLATQDQGLSKVDFDKSEVDDSYNEYGIRVDKANGRAIDAPSPDMIRDEGLWKGISDNSADFGVDSEDGKFKRKVDFINGDPDDEDDGAIVG